MMKIWKSKKNMSFVIEMTILVNTNFSSLKTLKYFVDTILEDLTPYDVRQLIMMEDEVAQTKVFLLNIYLKYL